MLADPDPLDVPADALKLHALAADGLIDADALAWALAQIGGRPTAASWYRFARVQLLLLGASLVAVGTGFFVAANWDSLSAYTKMAALAALMAGATLAGARLGLHTLSGRVAALLGGLGFGPLLALVGQTYQTGADAWELFAAWSAVLSVYALVIRFSGAWITAIVLMHTTVFLWLDQWLGGSPLEDAGLAITTGVALLDWALGVTLRFRAPDDRVLLGFVLGVAQAIALVVGITAIVGHGWSAAQLFAVAVALGLAGAGAWIFIDVRRDIGLVRGHAAVAAGLLAVAEGKIIFDVWGMREPGLLLMGLLLIVQGWLFGGWLLRLAAPTSDTATDTDEEEVEP